MARIQITDLNPSDAASMEELTEEELFKINGGGRFSDWLHRVADAIDAIAELFE
jgi:bacteriocin-like protein